MKPVKTILPILVVLSCLAFSKTARAENEFACSAYASVAAGFLSNNLGLPFTRGAALFNVTECVHTKSGLYGNVFLLLPIEKVNNGKEADARAGYRPKLSELPWLEIDGSIAIYAFTDGPKDFYTLNARLDLGHTFLLSPTAKLRLYTTANYDRLFTLHTDSLGIAVGASLNVDLPVGGTLRLGAEMWNYPLSPESGKGPIGSFTADLGFKIPGTPFVVGPRVQMVINDIEASGKVRLVYGAFISVPFGF